MLSPVDSSAVQPTELPLRLAGTLLMIRSAVLIPNTTGWIERLDNSLCGTPLIVNVMLVIVVVIGATTNNAANPPSYSVVGWPTNPIAAIIYKNQWLIFKSLIVSSY